MRREKGRVTVSGLDAAGGEEEEEMREEISVSRAWLAPEHQKKKKKR